MVGKRKTCYTPHSPKRWESHAPDGRGECPEGQRPRRQAGEPRARRGWGGLSASLGKFAGEEGRPSIAPRPPALDRLSNLTKLLAAPPRPSDAANQARRKQDARLRIRVKGKERRTSGEWTRGRGRLSSGKTDSENSGFTASGVVFLLENCAERIIADAGKCSNTYEENQANISKKQTGKARLPPGPIERERCISCYDTVIMLNNINAESCFRLEC